MTRASLLAAAALLGLAACTSDGGGGTTTTTGEPGTSAPPEAQPIDDGTHFAFVIVGEDESGAVTLGIDLADFLTGEEARQAAVDAGEIEEGEDLPNDFFILNEAQQYELLQVGDEAEFTLISAASPESKVQMNTPVFVTVYDGTYDGEEIYGVVAGSPIAMNVTIADGQIVSAEAVYLP